VTANNATCSWGFGNVRNYLLCRRTGEGLYQITLWVGPKTDDNSTGFKFYENNGWGGEKGYSALTWTGDQVFTGLSSGNIVPVLDQGGTYRLTVDLNANTVHVETLTSL
jgi:hypothetical protein